MNLTLEVNRNQVDKTGHYGTEELGSVLMMTPPISEDYWVYRVKLSDEQAILGFPKFNTVGIGFAVEEDWNTNLPYQCPLDMIWQHIEHNKGDESISDEDCKRAIAMIQMAAHIDQDTDPKRPSAHLTP